MACPHPRQPVAWRRSTRASDAFDAQSRDDNEPARGHTATTLSPKILLRCGKGREESWVDQLSAPRLTGAATENVAALSDGPLALFLDVDGTLLDIAERPDDVVTPSDLVPILAKAERKLAGAVALLGGRTIKDLDRLF
jgi:hypothetical protein